MRKKAEPASDGERIAALAASFDAFETYEHERWHKLNNDLTPLVNLPNQMARDLGKMEGRFRGEIKAATDNFERIVNDAVARAVGPVNDKVATLEAKVEVLEIAHEQQTGAKNLAAWLIQSPLFAWIAAAALMAWAWLNAHHGGPGK
jgi:hypothetical protein